ncbi:uncharacterized protein LOC115221348 isoform X1 [Octopus sinensis]|uniref:Uncharacterized protein LOC115221348 isoform X1 n=1 Tax=Octopus sinensis TaxID=2607531 RepID=A0A7E6FFK5_9MOLL|nr:uncharacterized protein LOC115221348 isoform X1 [Octopus sinensis]
MEIAKVWRVISQRFSVSSFITFGLCLVLTITILHFDARTRKIEEKSTANRFLSKKSLDDKAVHTPTSQDPVLGPCRPGGMQQDVHATPVCNTMNHFHYQKCLDDKDVHTPRPGPGSLYTRWGRTKCPRNSSLVYDGVVGGTAWNETGSGSNLLCLPNDPIWANYTGGVASRGHIYGSEYQTSNSYLKQHFSFANAESLFDHNVPCAVCLTRQPAVVMMLPARNECYTGWTAEYSGYLMTEAYDSKGRRGYVCVDYAPEADPAGYRNEGGATLFFVKGICGSLPCPPYVYGRELTCVVCSKY